MQLARWLGRPFFIRRTVRLRMTLSYGGLFLLSGAVLLAIASGVAAVASAHGGSLDLQARADGGLRVDIELPLATGPVGQRSMAGVPG